MYLNVHIAGFNHTEFFGGGGGGGEKRRKGSMQPLPQFFFGYSEVWLLSYLAKLMQIEIEGPVTNVGTVDFFMRLLAFLKRKTTTLI